MSQKYCEICDDGDGGCVFPYYGVAPHRCGFRDGKPVTGQSIELPVSEWPANFSPDDEPRPGEYPGCGVYTHCLKCGAPENGNDN